MWYYQARWGERSLVAGFIRSLGMQLGALSRRLLFSCWTGLGLTRCCLPDWGARFNAAIIISRDMSLIVLILWTAAAVNTERSTTGCQPDSSGTVRFPVPPDGLFVMFIFLMEDQVEET